MRFEYLISEKGKRVPGMERLVRNCQRPEGGCSPLPAQQQGAGVGHGAGAAHVWGWRSTLMLDVFGLSPYCQAPLAQLCRAVRRPTSRCGCRPTFAAQNRSNAAEPVGFRPAFHTRGGVVPMDDESTKFRLCLAPTPGAVMSLLPFLAPCPVVWRRGAAPGGG